MDKITSFIALRSIPACVSIANTKEEQYTEIVDYPKRFAPNGSPPLYAQHPELFPANFKNGYKIYHCTIDN